MLSSMQNISPRTICCHERGKRIKFHLHFSVIRCFCYPCRRHSCT